MLNTKEMAKCLTGKEYSLDSVHTDSHSRRKQRPLSWFWVIHDGGRKVATLTTHSDLPKKPMGNRGPFHLDPDFSPLEHHISDLRFEPGEEGNHAYLEGIVDALKAVSKK